MDILKQEESQLYELIKDGKKIGKAVKKISEIQEFGEDSKGPATPEKAAAKVFSVVTDMPKSTYKTLFPDSDIALGGLDLFSQAAIADYMGTIVTSSGLYKDMIYNTYQKPTSSVINLNRIFHGTTYSIITYN
jgi:hypothetical protein